MHGPTTLPYSTLLHYNCNLWMIPNIAIFSIYGWTYVPISHLLPIWSPCPTQLAILYQSHRLQQCILSQQWYMNNIRHFWQVQQAVLVGMPESQLAWLLSVAQQNEAWTSGWKSGSGSELITSLSPPHWTRWVSGIGYSTLFVTPTPWPSAFRLLQSIQ